MKGGRFRLDRKKCTVHPHPVRHWTSPCEAAQINCGCSIPGSVQGQILLQPDIVNAYDRGVRTRWSLRSLPNQTVL